jgi:competence protein ComEC
MGAWVLPVAAAALWLGILSGSGWSAGAGVAGLLLTSGGIGATGAAVAASVDHRRRREADEVVALLAGTPQMDRHIGARPTVAHRALAAGAVAVSFGLLGAGWGGLRQAHVRSSPLVVLDGHLVRVEGTLDGDPEAHATGWSVAVRADAVVPTVFTTAGSFRVRDPIWTSGRGPTPRLSSGERVVLTGTLAAPEGSFGRYLRSRGIPASVSVDEIRRAGPPRNPFLRAATVARNALRASLHRSLPEREAGLVMGLALGETSGLDPEIEQDFRATGLTHLTAVSGANVAMFLAPLLALAGMLRLGRTARLIVGIGAVVFFVFLTRAEPSVLRAAVMAGLAMMAIFLGRPRTAPALVGGAVLILLGFDPTLVHAIGFQLSVAATVGLVTLASPLATRLSFLPGPVGLAAATTVAAQAGVTPVILYHFGVVPTVGLPANLLAFAAVGPAMLLGLAAGLGGLLWEPLGHALAPLAGLPLRYLEAVADRLARSPLPSVTSATGKGGGLVAGVALVAGLAWWLRSGRKLPRRALALVLVAVPAFLWIGAVRAGGPSVLTATFFDVGQGDSILVRSPDGATILIDGGPEPDLVATKLAALGIRRIDLLVASHPHADHVTGLPAVLARYPVGLVVDPGCTFDSPQYQAFRRAVRSAGVAFRHPRPPERLTIGDVVLEVLSPPGCFTGTESDPNNDSLVLRLHRGDASILFTGDAEEPAQAELLAGATERLQATVLKVPHQGGATSLYEFFAVIHADLAVVSVGPNTYGHPVPDVLAELAHNGMRVVRTDRLGDITVVFDDGGLMLEPARS